MSCKTDEKGWELDRAYEQYRECLLGDAERKRELNRNGFRLVVASNILKQLPVLYVL